MKVIVISGPTASGKTGLAVDLAKKFGGEIVNFDSLLLYREINIGTAKPDAKEQSGIPHHMLDVRSIARPMNAADFSREALPIIEKLLKENKIVYLVGGSGFYLQALLKGMYDSPTTPPEVLERSEKLYEKEGIEPFLEILKNSDHESFKRYHENDHYRIRRAVEHLWSTGRKLSQERSQKDQENEKIDGSNIHGWDLLHIHLDLPKAEHEQIIIARTQKMIRSGLLDEVRELLSTGFTGEEKPLQSIGYKESLDFLSGKLKNLDECEERISISTRQLAKSQRTWFKRDQEKMTFHPLKERDKIFQIVEEKLSK